MKRIFTQFLNEWRSNLWLIVELTIVSSIIWYACDFITVQYSIRYENDGWSTDDVFVLNCRWVDKESPNYVEPTPPADAGEGYDSRRDDVDNFIARLRSVPEIKGVAVGTTQPHNYNFRGISPLLRVADDTVLLSPSRPVNVVEVWGDYMEIFEISGLNGEAPSELRKQIDSGRGVISSNTYEASLENPMSMLNGSLLNSDDSTLLTVVGAVVPPIKRAQFEKPWHGTLYKSYADDVIPIHSDMGVIVKVSPEYSGRFVSTFLNDNPSLSRIGNLYVSSITSLTKTGQSVNRSKEITIRSYAVCIGFLLVTVFLGLFGTFWFRTRQRVSEIAIRKANGATESDIFRRLTAESLLLLLFAVPLSLVIDWLLWHFSLVYTYFFYPETFWTRVSIELLATYLIEALAIIAGIWFPARTAMKVEPADILRGE